MPTFKNARKVQPVTPTKKVTRDLAEEILPLSPREFPPAGEKVTPPPAKPAKKVIAGATTTVAPSVTPPPPAHQRPPEQAGSGVAGGPPPQPPPLTKPAAKTAPMTPPQPPVKGPSRFKAFLTGCLIGGCLSPAVMLAGFFWIFTFATPTLTKQLANIIPPEVKGLFTAQEEPPSYPIDFNEGPAIPVQEPQSTATPLIRPQPVACGRDANCLLIAAKVCQSADGVIVTKGLEAKVSIVDLTAAGACQIEFLGSKALDPMDRVVSLVGKGMTCYFPMAVINEEIFSLEYDTQLNCRGTMWEELKSQSKTLPSTTTQNVTPSTTPLE